MTLIEEIEGELTDAGRRATTRDATRWRCS